VAHAKDYHTTECVLCQPAVRVPHYCDRTVIEPLHEHLQWLQVLHEKGAQEPDRVERQVLVPVHWFVPQGLSVPFKQVVVVQVRIPVWDVGVGVVSDDVLMVPSVFGRNLQCKPVRGVNF
jgi:hypothetical protein